MDINYWILTLVCALILGLLVWLVKRDRKDEKDFEEEVINSELKPNDEQYGKEKRASAPSKKTLDPSPQKKA